MQNRAFCPYLAYSLPGERSGHQQLYSLWECAAGTNGFTVYGREQHSSTADSPLVCTIGVDGSQFAGGVHQASTAYSYGACVRQVSTVFSLSAVFEGASVATAERAAIISTEMRWDVAASCCCALGAESEIVSMGVEVKVSLWLGREIECFWDRIQVGIRRGAGLALGFGSWVQGRTWKWVALPAKATFTLQQDIQVPCG
jgi:hypothetical protein